MRLKWNEIGEKRNDYSAQKPKSFVELSSKGNAGKGKTEMNGAGAMKKAKIRG